MSSYSTNEFKSGLKVMVDGDPCSILENEFVKPGKGQAFNRVKLRNLKSGRVIERTFKSGESLPGADVVDLEMQFLYSDGAMLHFMCLDSFEQHAMNIEKAQDTRQWLKEQDVCYMTLYNGVPLAITPPNFVTLKIIETDPGLRGDTAQGGTKAAKLETGATVRVPLFVEEGELIKVDTRSGSYVSRVKE